MTAESEVPSTGFGRRAGGRDLVLREVVTFYEVRCVLTAVIGRAKLCYLVLWVNTFDSLTIIGIKECGA